MKEGAVGGVHQKGLKEFRGHYFYLLGLESVANATSIPMDALIYDEVDLLDEEENNDVCRRIASPIPPCA